MALQVLSRKAGSLLLDAIRSLLGVQHYPRRLIVFVNPVSGARRAPMVYADVVKPMLEQAGIPHTLYSKLIYSY